MWSHQHIPTLTAFLICPRTPDTVLTLAFSCPGMADTLPFSDAMTDAAGVHSYLPQSTQGVCIAIVAAPQQEGAIACNQNLCIGRSIRVRGWRQVTMDQEVPSVHTPASSWQ